MKKRMLIVFLLFLVAVAIITAKLGYEQIFHASTLSTGAVSSRLREVEITPERGTIYDNKGSALAISVKAYSVYINPELIRKADKRESRRQDKEEVIQTMAEILELDPAEVSEKVERDSSFAYIKRRIADEQAEALKAKGFSGVYFLEESKRTYPKGSLASQVVGFAGLDNQGLSGLELQYDNTLLGTSGKLLVEYDGAGNEIPTTSEMYVPADPGNDIYLTLDETIQYVVERELKEVVENQNAESATALVMNVKTGALLAVANYPSFDPNHYADYDSSLWSNFAVNGLYEPGSTFKILTSAMGLEERVTFPTDYFHCPGYVMIGKLKMSCHKKIGHGDESFTKGVANSCNPVFVEVSRRVGTSRFYDYLEGFGMTKPTGVDLPGEATSLLVNEKACVPYDLGAMSIGQSNAYSPMQMITAISCVANGGVLMKPYIVDRVVDPDGNIVKQTEPEVIRRVISEETAREEWEILENVVSNGTGSPGQVEGYRVCGKTGTAEKISANGKGYSRARIVSFAGFAPADNPQIACIVIVDDPNDKHGGSTAGPVFRDIMAETLRYLEVPKESTVITSGVLEEVEVPNLDNMDPITAINTVLAAGLTPYVDTQGSALYTYVPAAGTKVQKSGNVYLYCGYPESDTVTMPSLYGRTIKDVDRIISGMGLSATMDGSGICTDQSIAPGTPVNIGTALTVTFRNSVTINQDNNPTGEEPQEGEEFNDDDTWALEDSQNSSGANPKWD